MMKWIVLFIVGINSCIRPIQGQNLAQTFNYAKEQLAQGWNERAEKAFKRVLFFDDKNEYRGECMKILADLSMVKGQYQEALNYLDQAYFLSRDVQEQNEFQTQRIQIFIETDQIHKALSEIYQMDETFDTTRINIYEAYCQYWLKDFDAMSKALSGLLRPSELAAFRLKAEKIERMNPKSYQTLSYIVPGLGQLLLGDVKQSANSLALSAGLATLFIHTARRLTFFDAVISVIPWFYRYYSGGAKLTYQLASEKKKERHRANLESLLVQLENQ